LGSAERGFRHLPKEGVDNGDFVAGAGFFPLPLRKDDNVFAVSYSGPLASGNETDVSGDTLIIVLHTPGE
jgi:hypothetical protein